MSRRKNDLFGVWKDPREPEGVGVLIIKGRRRIEAIAAAGKTAHGVLPLHSRGADLKCSAIWCVEAEQAEAARLRFGDGD